MAHCRTVEIHLRWGDADAFGHINNATVMQLLEEARTRGFWKSETGDDVAAFPKLSADSAVWSVVSEMQIKYLRQLEYQTAPVEVTLWVEKLAGASFDVLYELRTDPEKDPHVRARSTIVTIDASTGRPCRLPAEMRRALKPHSHQ